MEVTEYGPWEPWEGDPRAISQLRSQSGYWKRMLGLSFQPFEVRTRGALHSRIRARGVAGFVRAGNSTIEVRPKFLEEATDGVWRRALWEILVRIERRPHFGASAHAQILDQAELPDVLGWILLHALDSAAIEGMPRGYHEEEDWLPVLRGRLNAQALGNYWQHPLHIPCIFDVYGENTPLGRLIRWGAAQLSVMVRSPVLGRFLADKADSMHGIGTTPPSIVEVDAIQLPPQYDFLEPVLQACRLLLNARSSLQGPGALSIMSVLWKSSDVFERFVRFLLDELALRRPGWSLEKRELVLALPDDIGRLGSDLVTTPDYLLTRAGQTPVVLDAKYKLWRRRNTPKAQDSYQVVSGGKITNAGDAVLIFPRRSGMDHRPMRWLVQGSGTPTRLSSIFVDLTEMGVSGGEETILNRLDADLSRVLGP